MCVPTVCRAPPRAYVLGMESGPYAALVLDHGGVLDGTRDGRDLHEVLRAARDAGLRTAVLSNAASGEHLAGDWPDLVDVAVRSGDVGLSKPDPRVYALTAARLEVAPAACVFVDDVLRNVRGAVEAGMTGVLHRTYDTTVDELEALLGLPLRRRV